MAFESLSDKLNAAFKRLRGKGKLNEQDIKDAMREVRIALLEADVNFKVAKEFVQSVSEKCMGEEVMQSLTPAQQVVKIVNDELTQLMGGTEPAHIHIKSKPPTVIMMCGLQGAGKTTHAAKLAKYFIKQGNSPLLAACDIYRPAAIDQLKIVGKNAGAPVYSQEGQKPEQIAKNAVSHAKDHGNDIVILDTAGRLHVDEELMQELERIKKQVQVDETLLVVDSMAGQDAVNVAKTFGEQTGLDGVILTKLDGDTRGGSALSVRTVTGKPIKFAGVGEKLEDLELFYPDRMASRILGMGDVLSLIEKAQEVQDEQEAQDALDRMMSNKFNMNDMLVQFDQINKMGGAGALVSMLPSAAGKIDDDALQKSEKEFSRLKAIIQSMTAKERERPALIDPKRKRRIASGSGTRVEDVNRLLKQFEQMSKMMKKFKRNPKSFERQMNKMGMGGQFKDLV